MRIDFDVCCLKRPFDDQTDARMQMETTALAALLVAVRRGEHELVSSDAFRFENGGDRRARRIAMKTRVLSLLELYQEVSP